MIKLKGLQLITVLTVSIKTPTLDLIHDGSMQHTAGNALLPAMPVNDATMTTDVGALQTSYNGFKTIPPTVTEATVSSKKLTVVTAYNQNAGYIQGAARADSIAAGDINAGILLVNESGYKLKKTKAPTTKTFKVTNAGIGAVVITTKAVAAKAGYIRQYGPTTGKNIPPATPAEDIYSLGVSVYINNLRSGTMYGFREASILPISRATTNVTPTTEVKKIATPTVATKTHKASFTDGAEHYNWSPWTYLGVQ